MASRPAPRPGLAAPRAGGGFGHLAARALQDILRGEPPEGASGGDGSGRGSRGGSQETSLPQSAETSPSPPPPGAGGHGSGGAAAPAEPTAETEALAAESFWSTWRCRVLGEADDETDAEAIEQRISQHSRSSDRPLVVVGVFCQGGQLSAAGLLDALRLRGDLSEAAAAAAGGRGLGATGALAGLGGLAPVYSDEDNRLYLCLDSVAPAAAEKEGAAAFLVQGAQAEVGQLADLALLFSLCHVILWSCPGSAPRADAEACSLLQKLQDVFSSKQLGMLVEERPLACTPSVVFVHAGLRLPSAAAEESRSCPDARRPAAAAAARRMAAGMEKALDARWRAGLRRAASELEARDLLRLPRPCAAVACGVSASPLSRSSPFAFLDAVGGEEEDGFGAVSVDEAAEAASSELVDLFRSRVLDLCEDARGRIDLRRTPTLCDWAASAKRLNETVRSAVQVSNLIPSELEAIILSDEARSPSSRLTGRQLMRDDLSASLSWWAFSDLFHSLAVTQRGFEHGLKVYSSGSQRHGALYTAEVHEQLLGAALQTLQQRGCEPLVSAAAPAMRKLCDDLFAKRRACQQRSLTGHSCTLMEGHAEDHRSGYKVFRVCLCGKTQFSRSDIFEPIRRVGEGFPPTAACCRDACFLPYLPMSCDFISEPVVVPTSPRLGRPRGDESLLSPLPSALPDANGFAAVVHGQAIKMDPLEGSRLAGFSEGFQHFSRWRLPSTDPLGLIQAPPRYVYIGFEYQCQQGQRFFLPPPKSSGLAPSPAAAMSSAARSTRKEKRRRERMESAAAGDVLAPPAAPMPTHGQARAALPGLLLEDGEYETAPLCCYRLYTPCVKHHKKDKDATPTKSREEPSVPCVAQLARIWVRTPPPGRSGDVIEAAPRLGLVDLDAPRGADGRAPEVVCQGGKVVLPHDRLVQLVLPTVFSRWPGGGGCGASPPLPKFWELGRQDAERCRLLPYTFSVGQRTS